MAEYDLIDAYLAELAQSLRWRRDVADIVVETDDHLRCAVERQVEKGLDLGAAQSEVLSQFGDCAVVARAFATTHGGHLALPTRATRDGGIFAHVSAGLWIASPAVWHFGGWLYGRLDTGGARDQVGNPAQLGVILVMALTLMGAAAILVITMLTLRERHGGFGLPGMAGILMTGAGAVAALFGWFYVGWGSLVIVGTALVAADLLRHDIAPRGASLLAGVGMAVGGLVWGALRVLEVGTADEYGEYVIANAAGLTVGPLLLAVGLVGLGHWLSNEEPVELPEPTQLAPA